MMQGIEMLERDPETKVIVLVSKPPGERTAGKLVDYVGRCRKPMVVDFIGSRKNQLAAKWKVAPTLEDAARMAIAAVRNQEYNPRCFTDSMEKIELVAKREWADLRQEQRFIRGLYSGGTVCSEATLILSDLLPAVHSNIPPRRELGMADTSRSRDHVCLDMGDEEFTVGRAHPMIDPTLRKSRILQEAGDPETAVLLLDIELGYGSHEDPAGALVESIEEARSDAFGRGGYLPVVASIIGTHEDPQGYELQRQKLVDAGVLVMPSNAQAARMAAMIACRGEVLPTFFPEGDRQ